MNIVVCVKLVPESNDVKLNRETNTLIRDGIKNIINPFDMNAIEEALRIKEKMGGKVTVLSMGIPSGTESLKVTLALGVDEAVLLSDKAFAGADSLATSYTLALGIMKIGKYDLVICGKQSTDGDTAQVGPGLAEKLDLPHTTNVSKVEEIDEKRIRCHRLTESGYEVVEMSLPALITVVREINQPRVATIKGILKASRAAVKVLNAEDLGADRSKCGYEGSPTKVIRSFVISHDVHGQFIEGSPSEQAKKLFNLLRDSLNYHGRGNSNE